MLRRRVLLVLPILLALPLLGLSAPPAPTDGQPRPAGTPLPCQALHPGGAAVAGRPTSTPIANDQPRLPAGSGVAGSVSVTASDAERIELPVKIFPTGLAGSLPQGVEVAKDGGIWYTDAGAGQVGRFDPGTSTFGFYTVSGGVFRPTILAIEPHRGDVWFTNPQGAGSFIAQIPAGAAAGSVARPTILTGADYLCVDSIDGLAFDGSGKMWMTETEFEEPGYTFEYELVLWDWWSGTLGPITEYVLGKQNSSYEVIVHGKPHFTGCSRSEGILPDAAGNVWLTCEYSQAIAVKTVTGQLRVYPTTGNPQQLALDAAGNIWFSETTGFAEQYIGKINPRTARAGASPKENRGLTEYPLPSLESRPKGIRFDAAGTIWYAGEGDPCYVKPRPGESYFTGCIWQFNPSSKTFKAFPVPQPIAQNQAQGHELAIDARGNVWYAGDKVGWTADYRTLNENNGHLGLLAGVAADLATAPGGVLAGKVSTGAPLTGAGGTKLTIPAGSTITLSGAGPSGSALTAFATSDLFTGTISAPLAFEAEIPALPSGRSLIGDSAYNVAAMALTGQLVTVDLDQPATLSLPVTLPAGINSADVQIWQLDPATGTWQVAGSDAGNPGGTSADGLATLQTKHLGLFAVTLGVQPTPTYSPTPAGTPALFAYLPLAIRDRQGTEIETEIVRGW